MELEQQAKFDRLVRHLEKTAKKSIAKYYVRATLLAALGYGYITLLCLGIFGGLWLLLWSIATGQKRPMPIDNHTALFAVILLTVAAIWVQYTPLEDRPLDRDRYPKLFATIDRLQAQINTPPIHHVIINAEYNAGVYQAPRWGLFGGERNYLILGLPLMQSLSPEQFQATLAHELAHLSGNDSKFMGWIYRICQRWEQLTRDSNLFFIQSFFRWYEPLIKAYSFVLVRDREYAADALAGKIAGKEIAARDLIQTYVYQSYYQTAWQQEQTAQIRDRATPPKDTIARTLASLRKPIAAETARKWLGLVLGETTDTVDTHPCLRDRLSAVGYAEPPNWIPEPISQTAAEYFLGNRAQDLLTELDNRWYDNNLAAWEKQHNYYKLQQEYLDRLDTDLPVRELSERESIIRATLTTESTDPHTALPLWLNLLDRQPNCPIALYHAGKTLAARGEKIGCEYLERSIALDPDYLIPSCEELYGFHLHNGDLNAANLYLDWRKQHLPKQWRSNLERQLDRADRFIAHDLPDDRVSEIVEVITSISDWIDRAYLVCKPMQIFPDYPLYILAIDDRNFELEERLLDRLRIELIFDKHWQIITERTDKYHLLDRITKVPHSRII
jgi:Zn-dependent protease with chaperone function